MEPHKLLALLSRTRKPIFAATEDVTRTTASLLALAPYLDAREIRETLPPLRKFARHNPALLHAALKETEVVPTVALHGRRLAMLARVVPTTKTDASAELWAVITSTTVSALAAQAWSPADFNVIVAHLRRQRSYDAALVDAVVSYVAAVLPDASPTDLPALISIVASLPEVTTHPAKLLDAAAERCAAVAEVLTPGAIGHICGQFNRTLCVNANAVVVFQEEADRCAEKGDAFTAVQLFCFVARHKAEHISTDALIWLMERLASEELDVASVESLCAAVAHLPHAARVALRQELTDFVSHVSSQTKELLSQVPVEQGGLRGSTDTEAVQVFVSHFLELSTALNDTEFQWPTEFREAADACADAVEPLQESLLSAESSPFGLMMRLLEGPTNKCKQLGSAMLREASSQCMSFPALQVFRFLLVMGDQKIHDPATMRYLRDQFAKTAADIPPVQLSTALRCLNVVTEREGGGKAKADDSSSVASSSAPAAGTSAPSATANGVVAGESEEEDDYEEERLAEFLRFCVEKARKHLSEGAPLRCVMSTVENLYHLGCRDAGYFDDVAAYIEVKRDAVTAEAESADAAAVVCLAFGAALLEQFPEVHEFLLDVVGRGVKGEAALSPTQWMKLHDPSSTLSPLTPQQQESWDIVEEMVRTRADDTAALRKLAERYLELLPQTRPDDHKYFFGVFEEKVLKEDKLLKQCLDAIVDSGKLCRLSAPTIAGMLQSLASVRFTYFASVKRFLSSITTEQWMSMEAAPLVQILCGMEKLSLRTPAVLRQIGARLSELCRFLTPLDTAMAIRAFQSLGLNDPPLLTKLVAHAAASAKRFDEASMTVLFSTPSIHRLMAAPAIAQPLLLQASVKIHSPHRREKISSWVRKSSLPRDLIESTTTRLQLPGKNAARNQNVTLRLT
ncbi:putative mitochondrial mitochondrial RNA binding complex 1 subunit [Leptomonas pyrrhocoris]|uniref:Putative mitochondrial mitochondrial RNA binding complex 1 subunit n=1 Tax=Leptomonas pyrrhocoris TaxID=157538 RepID=A0A0N0DW17_LEPPY|nr:putative mitochondrial mitochondrial RNA binding complex 1 subunit [Leptomonas pyrrhocoris]KPA81172.1 putative mitochondrial mitochondrial RNA binding complex 1 subunit [Leptomonas pyrrhocoris]|eukprot:XP_015659611.1 putative mitochondrial mitochondrial RNA binding complex 1 subunit [Leptomonas pyrrhocoris]